MLQAISPDMPREIRVCQELPGRLTRPRRHQPDPFSAVPAHRTAPDRVWTRPKMQTLYSDSSAQCGQVQSCMRLLDSGVLLAAALMEMRGSYNESAFVLITCCSWRIPNEIGKNECFSMISTG